MILRSPTKGFALDPIRADARKRRCAGSDKPPARHAAVSLAISSLAQSARSLVAAIILICLTGSALAAGEADERSSVIPIPMDSSVGGAVAAPLSETGFWFLSTQHSVQSFDHSCPKFCPNVSRYDECVGFRPASYAEMLASLEPGVPVCIAVHGSFVDSDVACRESRGAWKWIRSAARGHRMQFIWVRWPSYRPITPLVPVDVNALGRRAARNGYYVAEIVQHLPPECPVCLMGHSHGTRVVSGALQLLAGGAIQGICHPTARVNGRPIRTVFSASAIDHHWLSPGNRYDRALCSTQCLLNLMNPADPALRIYPLRLPLIAKQPLGLVGLTAWDRRRLGRLGNRVRDCDVSRAVGARHLWPYYFRNRGLAMVLHHYVYFPDVDPNMIPDQERSIGVEDPLRSHSAVEPATVVKQDQSSGSRAAIQ